MICLDEFLEDEVWILSTVKDTKDILKEKRKPSKNQGTYLEHIPKDIKMHINDVYTLKSNAPKSTED